MRAFSKTNQPRGFAVYRIAAERPLRRIFERKPLASVINFVLQSNL
jgi:hypothetical protein